MFCEVTITEMLQKKIPIEADNLDDAKVMVMKDYYNGNIKLSSDDYVKGSANFISEKKSYKIGFIQ